jgi:hypothetical protein
MVAYIDQNTEEKAKNYYGQDILEGAKLLNSGISLEKSNELAELNLLANQKYVDDPDMPEKERDIMVQNAKFVIEKYYKEKLSGKSLEKALAGIDEYSDEFPEEFKEASSFHKQRRDDLKKTELEKIESAKNKEKDFETTIRKTIESGDVFDKKMDQAQIKAVLRSIYEPTEVVKVNGVDYKVSKYEKTIHELSSNPVMAAKLMVLLAEGMTLDTPKNMGKDAYATELDNKLRNSMDFPSQQRVVVGGKKDLKGIIKEIESRTY